jgi:uncharacterized protein YjaZ
MKASDVKSGLTETQPNPVRRCKRYASTIVRPYDNSGKKAISTLGKPLKAKAEKDPANLKTGHTKSSKLTELRKEAKALGIKKIMTIPEDKLKEMVTEAKKPDVEKLTPPTKEPDVEAMRKQIKAKGGNLPRGMKSRDPEALQKVLDTLP